MIILLLSFRLIFLSSWVVNEKFLVRITSFVEVISIFSMQTVNHLTSVINTPVTKKRSGYFFEYLQFPNWMFRSFQKNVPKFQLGQYFPCMWHIDFMHADTIPNIFRAMKWGASNEKQRTQHLIHLYKKRRTVFVFFGLPIGGVCGANKQTKNIYFIFIVV